MDPFYLQMVVSTETEHELKKVIDGSFRDDTINALIDHLYHLSELDKSGEIIINRVHKQREDHLEQLKAEINKGSVLKHQMQLWLSACKGEEGWKDVVYRHPTVKDPQTGENRLVVNLDAKLSDYIFHDKDAGKDTLVIEASYIPVMGKTRNYEIKLK